jgi:hypothetical protein
VSRRRRRRKKEEDEEEEEENVDYPEHHICTFWHKRVNNFAFLPSISTALLELCMYTAYAHMNTYSCLMYKN